MGEEISPHHLSLERALQNKPFPKITPPPQRWDLCRPTGGWQTPRKPPENMNPPNRTRFPFSATCPNSTPRVFGGGISQVKAWKSHGGGRCAPCIFCRVFNFVLDFFAVFCSASVGKWARVFVQFFLILFFVSQKLFFWIEVIFSDFFSKICIFGRVFIVCEKFCFV